MALSPRDLLIREAAGTSVTFVDISDKPVSAEVIRDGQLVPRVDLNEALVGDFVAPDRLDERVVQPRVVYQSIKPGQRVTRGTSVDIVLASKFLVPTDFVAGAHEDLRERSIGDVGSVFLRDKQISDAIAKAEKPEDLSSDIRGKMIEAARESDVAVNEGQAGRDFQALFLTVRAAQAFE